MWVEVLHERKFVELRREAGAVLGPRPALPPQL
jgi:hypothetical protein